MKRTAADQSLNRAKHSAHIDADADFEVLVQFIRHATDSQLKEVLRCIQIEVVFRVWQQVPVPRSVFPPSNTAGASLAEASRC